MTGDRVRLAQARMILAAGAETLEAGGTAAAALDAMSAEAAAHGWGTALWALHGTAFSAAARRASMPAPEAAEWFAQLTALEARLAIAEAAGKIR